MSSIGCALEYDIEICGIWNDGRHADILGMSATKEGDASRTGRLQADVAGGGCEHTLDCFRQAALGNIDALFHRIDRQALERAVLALAGARSVLVVGTHPARSVATHLHHVAAMRFGNWRLVEWRGAGPERVWSTLAAQDVVIAIATEPHATEEFEFARLARSMGARVVGISDGPESPLAECVDDLLLFPLRSPGERHSDVGATALVEVLVAMVAARGEGLEAARES